MYPTITEPELVDWLSQLQDGPSLLEGVTAQTFDLLKALNTFLEARVSAAQFKAALVTSYVKGRKDEAERVGVPVSVTYLLTACQPWIQENAVNRQHFEAALLQIGYANKDLQKKGYRSLVLAIWGHGSLGERAAGAG